MGKTNNKVTVKCVGRSSTGVTGSQYLIECPTGEKILIDCGLYQSNKPYEDYKVNNKNFDFKSNELTAVVLTHIHADHSALLPKLIKDGFGGKVYINYKALDFLSPMLTDSAKIMARDALMFSKKLSSNVQPIYAPEDVEETLKRLRGIKNEEGVRITENVSIKLQNAGHIFASSQVSLYIKTPSGSTKKVSFTGDLGNTVLPQPFVEEFDPIIKTNVLFGECTYNDAARSIKKDQRQKDLEKLESVIRDTCFNKKGKVLIPVFALQRVETMLYYIYQTFKDDETFNIPVIIDSPLAAKLIRCYEDNLSGEDGLVLSEILEWKNVRIVEAYEESAALLKDPNPKVILASSGMLTNGRSVLHLMDILPRKNCSILICGYQAEGTIGRKIKDNQYKDIKINGKYYNNNCSITSLMSFSSHMQYEELMNYYTNIANNGAEKIVLVHSDEGKLDFKKTLEEKISKIGKTTKVIAANRDQVVKF